MKIVIKIVAVLATLIGIMAVITGSRVLLGLFVPDYQYFTSLVSYNVIIGAVSIIAGILIWQRNSIVLFFAYFITGAHIIVFLLLKTVFSDIISDHSVNAMTFRSVIWVIITMTIWKGMPKAQKESIEGN